MKAYYSELDIVKGIGILLVMLGHSFSTAPINIYAAMPFTGSIIREFQMPLFFVASGFLFTQTTMYSFFVKKSKRLLIPYVFFGVLTIILKITQGYAIGGLTLMHTTVWGVNYSLICC